MGVDPRGLESQIMPGCELITWRDIPGKKRGSYQGETANTQRKVLGLVPGDSVDACPPTAPTNCVYYQDLDGIFQDQVQVVTYNVYEQFRESFWKCTLREPRNCGGFTNRTRNVTKVTQIEDLTKLVPGSEVWADIGKPYTERVGYIIVYRVSGR